MWRLVIAADRWQRQNSIRIWYREITAEDVINEDIALQLEEVGSAAVGRGL